MKSSYQVDSDNHVTLLHPQQTEISGEFFSSAEELFHLSEKWPEGRLLEIRNSLPGLEPVKDIANPRKVVTLIWRTVTKLMAPAAANAPAETNPKAKAKAAKKDAPKAARAPKKKPTKSVAPRKSAQRKAAKPAADKPAKTEPGDSKKAQVLEMIQRKGGATLDEICAKTGWQRHTTRSWLSTVPAKMGLQLKSFKNDQAKRTYAIS